MTIKPTVLIEDTVISCDSTKPKKCDNQKSTQEGN